jgi:hypothetical protein
MDKVQKPSNSEQNLSSSHLYIKPKNKNVGNFKFACYFLWYETWFPIISVEHRLKVSEDRFMRRISGFNREELA